MNTIEQQVRGLLSSIYSNKLIQLSCKNSGGSYIGRMLIETSLSGSSSQQGISASILKSYLHSVQKKNYLTLDSSFRLTQSQLQPKFDAVFKASQKFFQGELHDLSKLLQQHELSTNAPLLVLEQNGDILILPDKLAIEQAIKSGKLYAIIGKIINVQGVQILDEMKLNPKIKTIKLSDVTSYKQVLLNNLLVFTSVVLGISIFSDVFKPDLMMNLLNPLIKNEQQHKLIFGKYSNNYQATQTNENSS